MIELKANRIEFSNFLFIYQIFKEILILLMQQFDRHKCIHVLTYLYISNFNEILILQFARHTAYNQAMFLH